jgi:hypothetical protein
MLGYLDGSLEGGATGTTFWRGQGQLMERLRPLFGSGKGNSKRFPDGTVVSE